MLNNINLVIYKHRHKYQLGGKGTLKYCRECGKELKEGALFCAECGTPVKQPKEQKQVPQKQAPVQQSPVQPEQTSRKDMKPKQPLFKTKKSKVSAIAIAVLVVAMVAAYFIIDRTVMSPTAVANSFVTAIQENDIGKVKQHINEGQLEMDATDEQVEAFVNHLNEYPRLITEISEQLSVEVNAFENGIGYSGGESGTSALATLKQEGKKWLLFDHYVVQVRPVYINVESTADETKIFLDDQEEEKIVVNSESSEKLGPLLPGQYEVKAVVSGAFGDVEQTEQIDLLQSEEMTESEIALYFDFSAHYLPVYSDNEDATVYVNGESTEKQVKDFSVFGPVPLDGSVEVYAEKEFATSIHKSDTNVIDENTYQLDLYLDYTDYDEEYDLERAEREEIEKLEGEAQKVAEAIYDHYGNITQDNYQEAYNLFSSSMQGKFDVDNWSEGLQANILDDVTTVQVKSVDGNNAEAYIEMTSYDDQDDGSVLVQVWKGDWSLVKESGAWKLDSSSIEKVDSWTE